MNRNLCKKIIENKEKFKALFASRQIEIIEKYQNNVQLSNTEKTYFYAIVKKKIEALLLLKEDFHINGQQMIPKRIEESKNILRNINKKAFISGSFLFKEEYNDIDIFVISKKRRSFFEGKKHYTYITEKDLKKPILNSSLQYCVANFSINIPKPEIKRPEYRDVIFAYQQAIAEILNDEDQKTIRSLVFENFLVENVNVPDSYTTYLLMIDILELPKQKRIEKVNEITKNLLKKMFSKKYLYREILTLDKQYDNVIAEWKKHDNILIYKEMIKDVKNSCRSKIET